MKIAWIGLGIMGSRMAANLLNSDATLVVYNRTKSKAGSLLEAGAEWAESPAAAAEQADILFTMLSAPDVVEQVALGQDGFLDALRPGSTWVDCTTVNPSFSQEMAFIAAGHQVRFLEAPVAGTKGPAQQGQLLFFAAGPEDVLETCRPLLERMGRQVNYLGPDYGRAASLKMVFNLLLGQAMLAFSEGLALGQALGLSRETLFNTLLGGPVVPPSIQGKRPKIENEDWEADFPLHLMRKDLHLAALTAYENGVALPSTNTAKEVYALAEQAGLGEQDFSAIYAFLNQASEGA